MSLPWLDTGKEIEPDDRHRVTLGVAIKTPPGVRYRVKQNAIGQIMLDPVKTVPAYEAWVHENPEILASFKRGVAQAEAGVRHKYDLGVDDGED